MKRHSFLLLLAVLTVGAIPPAARAQSAAGPEVALGTPAPREAIAPGDVVEITVFGEPELSRTVTVPANGPVSYPYLPSLALAGATPVEVEGRVRQGLLRTLTDPQVTVTVTQRHVDTVSVLGAVKSPGKHTLPSHGRVLDALTDSGGLAVDRPEWATATLIHEGTQALPIDLVRLLTVADPAQNLLLQPGDVLLVQARDPEQTHVQVLGEVARPGPVPVPPDGSIAAVVTAAGGPTARAALSRGAILRHGASLPVDLRGLLTDGQITPALALEPGDTLVIPQNQDWFAVVGAVAKGGVQAYPDGQSVTALSALALAGGQTPEADLKSATLIRPQPQGPATITPLDLTALLQPGRTKHGEHALDVVLQPGDVLFVPGKTASHGLRLGDVLPFASLLNVLHL